MSRTSRRRPGSFIDIATFMDQHIRQLTCHVRRLRDVGRYLNNRAADGTLDPAYVEETWKTLRPCTKEAKIMRDNAEQLRARLPEAWQVCDNHMPRDRTRSKGKRVRGEETDESSELDSICSPTRLSKKLRLTPSSPQSIEDQFEGTHILFDETMADAPDFEPVETDDTNNPLETDDTTNTTETDGINNPFETDDINDLVESRLKLQRERRAERIDNPDRLSPSKDDTPVPAEKRKRLSDVANNTNSVDLRTGKPVSAPARASKRHKRSEIASMQGRAASLRQRSEDFFAQAAEHDRHILAEHDAAKHVRPGTRETRTERLRKNAETLRSRKS